MELSELVETQDLLPSTQNAEEAAEVSQPAGQSAGGKSSAKCCECYAKHYRIRRVRAKGAFLVLVVNALVEIGYYGALGHVFQTLFRDVLDLHPVGLSVFFEVILVYSIPQALYPVAGWLADVHFGRYKTIRGSLWFIWFGFVTLVVVFAIHRHFGYHHWFHHFTYYGIFPIVFILVNIGLAGFQANIIPFGLDQMPTGSADELSAFIQWYYWSRNLGTAVILTVLICTVPDDIIVVAQASVEVVFITVALICCYCFKKYFVIEPCGQNPFKTVYDVLKFASLHKSSLPGRSALTYWEDNIPSRIDQAKSRYGGPFTTESVENVKTFLRISLVLVALGGFVIVYNIAGSLFASHLRDLNISQHCSLAELLLSELNSLPIVISIPIYEFLIVPLFWRYIPTTLRRIGIGMVVGILGVVLFLGPDIYGHIDTYHDGNTTLQTECFLVNATTIPIDVSSAVIILPYTLIIIAEMLVFISALEFISAQSPSNMKGMLIGIYYFVRGVFALVASILVLALSLGYLLNPTTQPSCGVLYFSLNVVLATIGLLVYIVVARRYKKRQRDDADILLNQHAFVENYYGAVVDY